MAPPSCPSSLPLLGFMPFLFSPHLPACGMCPLLLLHFRPVASTLYFILFIYFLMLYF